MDMTKYAGSESKYLKASDLQGKRPTVVIESVSLVEFDDDEGNKETKPSAKLRGKDKELVMNATSVEEIMRAFGVDSDNWIGKSLILSTKFYKNFGKEGIIVSPVIEADDPDDDIPF